MGLDRAPEADDCDDERRRDPDEHSVIANAEMSQQTQQRLVADGVGVAHSSGLPQQRPPILQGRSGKDDEAENRRTQRGRPSDQ